jgi:hypothetical protein
MSTHLFVPWIGISCFLFHQAVAYRRAQLLRMISKNPLLVGCFVGIVLRPSQGFGIPPQQLQLLPTQSSSISQIAVFSGRSTVHLHNTADDFIESDPSEDEKNLSLDTVAELIDTTFVNACLQLAKG